MRFAVLGTLLVAGIFISGCLGGSSKPTTITDPTDEVVRFAGDLPPVYVSTDEFFEQDYAAPDFPRVVEVLTGGRGAEPNIGVTSKGGIFITAFDSTQRSLDGGKTWQTVYDFGALAPGTPDPFTTSDPMLWVDPDTDRIFTNQMWPILTCSSNIISDDNGNTWTHVPMSCGLPVVDHQKIMTAPSRLPVPMGVYKNLVYYCYNKLATTNCAVSYDGGLHYQYDVPIASVETTGPECGGINGHPAAALDGTVYVPHGYNCGTPHVSVTEDNGLTWTTHAFGEATGLQDIDPDMTITPDGTAYYYGRGEDGSGYLYRSKDKFETVQGPFRVNPPDVQGVVFAGITSGDDGRIAISYLGNREWKGNPDVAPDNVTWHLFMTYSYDAAAATPTFQTHQVTPPSDPVQIGCLLIGGGGNPCRNLLDFIDMVHDKDGRIYVAFTDGCTEKNGCSNNPKATGNESRDRAVALAVQDHGPSLLASKGLLPSLGWITQVNNPTKK